MHRLMTEDMLKVALEAAGAKMDEQGLTVLPERHTLSLYLAHGGASLSITRVVRLSLRGEMIKAEDDKGELFVAHLSDAFAASVSIPAGASMRKAGFLR
jgi:hypothetical protein